MPLITNELDVLDRLDQVKATIAELYETSNSANLRDKSVAEQYRALKIMLQETSKKLKQSERRLELSDSEAYYYQPAIDSALNKLSKPIGCLNDVEFQNTLYDARFDIEYYHCELSAATREVPAGAT